MRTGNQPLTAAAIGKNLKPESMPTEYQIKSMINIFGFQFRICMLFSIIDAKAYANGYMIGASDKRAIKEYINHYCPKLKKEGIQRIAFILISNAFKSGFSEFINDVTWKTDIKRFELLSQFLHKIQLA